MAAGPLVSDANMYVIMSGLLGLIGALGLFARFMLGLPSDDQMLPD